MNIISILTHATELIAAIVASIFYFKYKNTPLKYFGIYLWYVFINEISVYFLLQAGLIKFELINIYSFITILYVLNVCRQTIEIHRLKKTVTMLIILMIGVFIVEFVIKGIQEPWIISKIVGPILAILALLSYLVGLFQSVSILNPFRDLFTYFLLGFTLFFVASPVILLARIFYQNQSDFHMTLNLAYIMSAVVILMYAIFSFGFIWCKDEIKRKVN